MHPHSAEETFYQAEFHQIKAQLQLEKDSRLGLVSILRQRSYRKRLLIGVILVIGQQACGIIPLQNYQVILYE